MVKTKLSKRVVLEYLYIAFGAALMALGIGVFLVDAKVVPGGASGLSMAFYYLSGNKIPVGTIIWAINVPLYIWGLKELGHQFAFRTFFAFTLNSIFIDLFRGDMPGLGFIRLQDSQTIRDLMQHDFFFLILLGTVFLGAGLGIIFKFKGTTAGSDIVVAILNKRIGLKPGLGFIMIDFFVISIAGLIIELKGLSSGKPAFSLTLYAFFLLFLSSFIVDIILDGIDYARQAMIISDKNDDIAKAIMNDMSRGATALKSKGLYLGVERDIIMTVVSNKEISTLTTLVKSIDPDAFVIINNVHEVLGSGFRKRF